MRAAELRALAGVPARRNVREVAPADLRIIAGTLMELLSDARGDLDRYGRGLQRRFAQFACDLRRSGFLIDVSGDRHARALAQRRIGELAEARGDVAGAMAFYDLALRSWRDIGCRRALERLRHLDDHRD